MCLAHHDHRSVRLFDGVKHLRDESGMDRLWNATLLGIIGGGCVAVTVVDTCGALISRALTIRYGYFGLVSLLIYSLVGALATRRGSVASAAAGGVLVSVFDATVGWWIAWRIGPGRVDGPGGVAGITLLFLPGLFAVSLGTTVAVVSGLVSERLRSRRS